MPLKREVKDELRIKEVERLEHVTYAGTKFEVVDGILNLMKLKIKRRSFRIEEI